VRHHEPAGRRLRAKRVRTVGAAHLLLAADAVALRDEDAGRTAARRRWDVALLLEIHFTLEQGGFGARMVLLLPDAAIRGMKEALDHFLEAL